MSVEVQCYLGACMVVFAFLGTIWATNRWVNTFLKFVFIVMSINAGVLLAYSLGFVVRI